MVHAARLDLPGTLGAFRVLVNSSDITHARRTEEILCDLSGRLITAQEEERSRVARELHDDLNQRMALLSVELEQLSAKDIGEPKQPALVYQQRVGRGTGDFCGD